MDLSTRSLRHKRAIGSEIPAALGFSDFRKRARVSIIGSASREIVLLCWDIGRGIAEKQAEAGWGDAVVEKLARDPSHAFPEARGFSSRIPGGCCSAMSTAPPPSFSHTL